ncbi:MAG: Ig-like domain-containing protein [bacterium]|nr:Ig-like domain-containing protein [bacterium]
MRYLTLVLVLGACAAFAVGTDLGEVAHDGAAYLPPEPNGFLDVLYMTIEFDLGQFVTGIATVPSYGWVIADDFVLDQDSNIEKITYWVLVDQEASGYVHRFWNDTGGSGPGSELNNADADYTLTSTGQYASGYLVYKMEAEMDYELDAGHYWGASYFSSGFWYMTVTNNAWDDMAYFDYGGGGSGPWYSSQYMFGAPYGFFQVIEGTAVEPEFDPPYVDYMDPDDGEVGVPLDSNIVFHCVDDLHPVDIGTINFTVQDSTLSGDRFASTGSALSVLAMPARTLPGDLVTDDADPMDVVCTWTGDDPFYEGVTVTCTVAAGLADDRGNEMTDDFVWSFTTEDIPKVAETTWGAIKAEF